MTTSISEFMARAHARAQESRLQQAVVEQKARRVWSRFDAKLEAAREMSSQTVENQRAIFELADARAWLSHISMDWSLMSTYMLYNVAPDVVLMSVDFDRLLRESKGAMHEPSLAHLHAANCRNPFKRDIFKASAVVVPCHLLNSHWGIVIIYVPQRKVKMYDSLSASSSYQAASRECLLRIKKFLQFEHCFLYDRAPLGEDWVFEVERVQQQRDANNCGVYACRFWESFCLSRNNSDPIITDCLNVFVGRGSVEDYRAVLIEG